MQHQNLFTGSVYELNMLTSLDSRIIRWTQTQKARFGYPLTCICLGDVEFNCCTIFLLLELNYWWVDKWNQELDIICACSPFLF